MELAARLASLGFKDCGSGCWSRNGETPRHWTEMVGAPADAPPGVVIHNAPPASPGFASSLTGTVAISAAAAGVAAGLQNLDMIPESVRPYVGLVLLAIAAALATAKGMQLYGSNTGPKP